MERKMTIASYAETAGTATKAVSAEVAGRCTGNAETATALKVAAKVSMTGDAEGDFSFDGVENVIVNVKNKNSEKAKCDEYGNNIFETYAQKSDLENYARTEAVAAVCVSRKELAEYISKSEMYLEKFNGVPCLFVEADGKKYKFTGVEV